MVPYEPSRAPNANDVAIGQSVRTVFAESKLPGTAQISQIKPAHLISRGDYVVCLRSSDAAQTRRYALYFSGAAFVHSQLAVQVDGCEDEAYTPFTGEATASR